MKKNLLELLGHRMTYKILLLSVVAIVAASCQKDDLKFGDPANSGSSAIDEDMKRGGRAPAPGDASIAEIAIGAGFDELVGALVYVDEELGAGLVDLFLDGTDQYTVFAPTNDAFEVLYGAFDDVDEITDLDAELVLDVLLYHVVEGRRAANSVVPPVRPRTITTLLGETFSVNSEGVITDIAGQEVNIVGADISASNGIIHVIDAVLLPLNDNDKRGRAAQAAPAAPAPGDASIAAIAIDAGFSELVGALVYVDAELDAGLVDLFLNGTDQYTVFAPTNDAFETLYGAFEDVGGITDLPAELVLDVLLYHVTEGRRAANSVVPPVRPRTITTLLGATFTVDRNAMITAIGNTAKIVAPDISASNGIIHVIDAVILPVE